MKWEQSLIQKAVSGNVCFRNTVCLLSPTYLHLIGIPRVQERLDLADVGDAPVK